mmetsp:Transcript_40342/g.127016  ORF Transcript_40342/g.127016 Transcript_40342/m.127016 type:complete len:206 (-) Transcript_40342:55-672(-)
MSFSHEEAEAICNMKLVGMEEIRAVTAFIAKRDMLSVKMQAELTAKRLPQDVIEAVNAGISGVSMYNNSFEDFCVDAGGTGKIFKATIMMKPDFEDDESVQVAMAISGAKFDAAREVEEYEQEVIPEYRTVDEVEEFTESGVLGNYKVLRTVSKLKQVGTRTKRTPIFRKTAFTNASLAGIQKFLEGKTMGEVKLLYAPDRSEES